MRFNPNWRALHKDCRGLESIEYLLIAALIMIAAIAAWKYLGTHIQSDVKRVAGTVDDTVKDSVKDAVPNPPTQDPPVTTVSPPIIPPTIPPPTIPPPAPMPPNPMGPGVRHHIGDGSFTAGMGGGNLANEGTTYSTGFTVTQAMLDYAREHGGKLYLKYDGFGVDMATNTMTVNGRAIGMVANGTNSVAVDVSAFSVGNNVLSVAAGSQTVGLGISRRVDFDDFEFNNLSIGYQP